jgi:hypothetical protein
MSEQVPLDKIRQFREPCPLDGNSLAQVSNSIAFGNASLVSLIPFQRSPQLSVLYCEEWN